MHLYLLLQKKVHKYNIETIFKNNRNQQVWTGHIGHIGELPIRLARPNYLLSSSKLQMAHVYFYINKAQVYTYQVAILLNLR